MIWHVLPNGEEHNEEDSRCCCEPNVQVLENGDLLVIHNSFDKREIIEEIYKILKS